MSGAWSKRVAVGIVGLAAAIFLVGGAAYLAGIRVNTTKSIPVGLYRTDSAVAERGDYVLFCPPPRDVFEEAKLRGYISAGFCPDSLGFMMKRILAAKNDVIDVADDGVRVNGELLPFSAPREADGAGRAMPNFRINSYVLADNEVLLMSDVSATSFDGRYFGPINRAQIKTVVRPIFTW